MVIPGRSSSSLTEEQNKFKYQSKERDLETGYDYFEARFYDSSIGRFLQVDPHGEKYVTMNPYMGMFNNPLSLIDPTGKDGKGSKVKTIILSLANMVGYSQQALTGATVLIGGAASTSTTGPVGPVVGMVGLTQSLHGVSDVLINYVNIVETVLNFNDDKFDSDKLASGPFEALFKQYNGSTIVGRSLDVSLSFFSGNLYTAFTSALKNPEDIKKAITFLTEVFFFDINLIDSKEIIEEYINSNEIKREKLLEEQRKKNVKAKKKENGKNIDENNKEEDDEE
jgi:RHS repeat-associated protein